MKLTRLFFEPDKPGKKAQRWPANRGAVVLAAAAATCLATVAASAAGATPALAAAHPKANANHKKSTFNPEAPPTGTFNLSETGSTLLYPLFQVWASAYHHRYPNVTVTPQATGSGTGISDAEEGSVDIGASDAYLSNTVRAAHPNLMNIALAISAQQVNYNIPGLATSTHLKLSGLVLSEIYQGKITTWDDPQIADLNPGVKIPNLKIVALHRSDGSGDTFLFTTYLSDTDPAGWGSSIGSGTTVAFPSIPNALGEVGNGGMVTGCAATPGCVAYIGISYLGETSQKGLGEAMLENARHQFVLPTPASISAEAAALTSKTPPDETLSLIYDNAKGGYPIINYEYAIVPTNERSRAVSLAVRAFLYWAIDPNGGSEPRFLKEVNFEPLPPGVVKLSKHQIARIS
jgi:phosphate transport system substrate-binding protein